MGSTGEASRRPGGAQRLGLRGVGCGGRGRPSPCSRVSSCDLCQDLPTARNCPGRPSRSVMTGATHAALGLPFCLQGLPSGSTTMSLHLGRAHGSSKRRKGVPNPSPSELPSCPSYRREVGSVAHASSAVAPASTPRAFAQETSKDGSITVRSRCLQPVPRAEEQ